MAVTEIAIIHSVSGGLDKDLEAALRAAPPVLHKWRADTFPGPSAAGSERGTAMFQQIEDPAKILLTEPWDSVSQHWQWIGSDANKGLMGGLATRIAVEGDDKVVFFHLDAEIFTPAAPEGYKHLVDSPVISIGRMYVSAEGKAAFAAKFDEVKGILEDFAKPYLVRGGWRVDKEDEGKEEFVMFVGWDAVEDHMAFAETPGFAKYSELRGFVTGADIKHYKRFI